MKGAPHLPSSRRMSAIMHMAAAMSLLSVPVTSCRMSSARHASGSATSGRPSPRAMLACEHFALRDQLRWNGSKLQCRLCYLTGSRNGSQKDQSMDLHSRSGLSCKVSKAFGSGTCSIRAVATLRFLSPKACSRMCRAAEHRACASAYLP